MNDSAPRFAADIEHGFDAAPEPAFGGGFGTLAAPGRRDAAPHRQRVAWLAEALEADVIPRLVLARHAAATPPAAESEDGAAPAAEDVQALAGIAMRGDLVAARAFLAAQRARNVALPRLYLDLLGPAARLLGEWWVEDRCDFTSVTIGLCCLQQLVLENSHGFEPRPGRRDEARRVLLTPTPGEQHGFGLLIVGEFFRRQGWDVSSGTGASARELVATVRQQWFSMVGLSLSCDSRIEPLAALIRDLRRASRNPRIGILVGGRVFAERPELVALVGADATAADGQQAVLKAETLLALLMQDA
jgi:methanogenic corrinoid protein MtbC1